MEMSYSSFIVKSIEDPVTLRTVVLCPRNTRNSRSLSVSSRRKFRRRRDSEPGEFQLSQAYLRFGRRSILVTSRFVSPA